MTVRFGGAPPGALLVVLTLFAASSPVPMAAAQDGPRLSDWKRVVLGDIEAVGPVSDRDLRRSVSEITAFRAALTTLYPGLRVSSPVPLRIVVFPNQQQLVRYSPRDDRGKPQEYVGGYFSPGADVNIIALGGNRSDIVFHEYAHYVFYRNFHSLPGWFNEGLAEFFSTFEADWKGGRSLVGRPPNERLRSLRSLTFLPLRQILFATPADMEKMWKNPERIEMYYSESWALVHYLMIGRQNKSLAVGRFIQAVETGTPVETAFTDAFGELAQVENELRNYMHRFAYSALAFEMAEVDALRLTAERIPVADARSMQGDLLLRMGAPDEARKDFAAALKADPAHTRGRVGMALLDAYADRLTGAAAALRDIHQAHPRDFATAYHLGDVLLDADKSDEALTMYRRAIDINAESTFAWAGRSMAALAAGRHGEAQDSMTQLMRLQSDPDWYRSRAYAALRFGVDATAASDAREYLKLAGWESRSAAYVAFVGAIADWRLGRADEAERLLEQARGVTPATSWTTVVLDFMQGRIPADKFLARAKSNGEKTEAHAYIGFKDALAARRDEALAHFRWVRDHGAKNYVEYGMAKGEIRRMERQ